MSLPNGWASAPIDSLGDVKLGKMLDKSKNQGSPARYLRNINVRWFDFDLADLNTILASDAELELLSVRDGDLFVCEGGEPGRCAVWRRGDTGLVFQKALHRFRTNDAVVPEYLMYRLRHDAESGVLGSVLTGTTIKHFTRESFLRYVIPLAPRAEQQRIADKLDALLARVDACRTRLDRVPVILKRFRQAVLEAAISGALTEEWRQSHDGRREWMPSTIGAVALDLRYGTSQKCNYQAHGIAVLRIPNIADHGRLDIGDLKRREFDKAEVERLALRTGDLLVIRSNGSADLVGKTSIVTNREAGLLFAGYLMRLRVDTAKALPMFTLLVLSSPQLRSAIELMSKSTSGVNNLNSDELRSLPLSLPPLDEQAEIVRHVEYLFAFADALQARYESARVQVARLTPALLAKAFRGELVPQDPSDEPAAALLECVRAAAPATTSARTRKAAAAPTHRRRASGRDHSRT